VKFSRLFDDFLHKLHLQGESGGTDQTPGVYCTRKNDFKKLKCCYPIFICFRLLKKMFSKRTPNIKTNPLFLTVSKDWEKHENSYWYKIMSLGYNQISKWAKSAAKSIGINTKFVKITNHSNRSSTVSQLSSTGINAKEFIKITGHNNSASILPYLNLSENHHKNLISNLRSESMESEIENSSINNSSLVSLESSNNNNNSSGSVIYNNCTYNITYHK